jgi:CDP-glucose 4,6-dehydratase
MTRLLKDVFRNMRVLVTGHTGFKGSWLSLWLKKLGAHVVGYSLDAPTNPSLFEICGLKNEIISINGDIRNRDGLMSAFKRYSPEIIFHLAAQALVIPSYSNPIETYDTNVMGTVNILDVCRQSHFVKAVVNVTSDKCYENHQWIWGYRENDTLGGCDPYSNSKACSELVTAAFLKSFFNPDTYRSHGVALASARAGNVIGGGDWAAYRLIPDCISALQNNRSLVVRHPDAVRPWQHVLEPLYGYLLLAAYLYQRGSSFSGQWNFGPEDESLQSVSRVVDKIGKKWGNNVSLVTDKHNGPYEAQYLKLDCSKAKARINWFPQWNLDTAVEKAVGWYKAYSNGKNMLTTTLNQIEQYEARLMKAN